MAAPKHIADAEERITELTNRKYKKEH